MAKKFPLHPAHPERNCWGCDKYCSKDNLACGNGSDRTQHPVEMFGEDWFEWTREGDSEQGEDSVKSVVPGEINHAGRG